MERAEVVVLEAPAGFGKTSLLRLWHERRAAAGEAVFWLTCDADDNDLGRFGAHLHAALASLGEPRPASKRDPGGAVAPIDTLIARIDELGAGAARFSVFIDEIEAIEDEAVVRLLVEFRRRVPPSGTLFVSGRRIPELQLARGRAEGRVLTLGAEDLRFCRNDAAELLRSITGTRVPDDVVTRAHERTEGWAAALHLAGLSLAGGGDVSEAVPFAESPVALSEYLAQEVLATQSPEIRQLLLRASVLDTVTAELCERVLGCDDAAALLARIERDNLLVTRTGAGEFRFHQLFRGFLARELARTAPQETEELHREAARWFTQRGDATKAIRHALASQDSAFAGGILEQHAQDLTAAGRLTTVVRGADALPRDTVRGRPRLAAYYAACLVGTFQHRRAAELIDELSAPEMLEQLDDDALGILLFAVPFQMILQERYAEALPVCDASIARLAPHDAQGRTALLNVRSVGLLHLHRYREVEAVEAEVRRLAAHATTYGQVYGECVSAMTDLAQGRLSAAHATFTTALQTAVAESSATSAPTAVAAAGLIETSYELGDSDAASDLLGRYLPTIDAVGAPDALIQAHVHHIRLAYRQRGYPEACTAINALKRLGYERDLGRLVACAGAEHSRLALLEGDLGAARRYLELAEAATPYVTLWDESGVTLRARILIAGGDPREAGALLAPELLRAAAGQRRRYALKLEVLAALAHDAAGETTRGLDALERCLAEAHRERFARIFLDEGPPVVDLLRELVATRRCGAVVRASAERLLDLVTADGGATAPADDFEPLSPRELEVLTLVAHGLSNQDIAERLVLSLPTVKTHVARILGKLAAKNRTEAVATARRRRFLAA